MKFRKKPVVIEAIQLSWRTWSEICDFVSREAFGKGVWVYSAPGEYGDNPRDIDHDRIGLLIKTPEGTMLATEGDWIIKGVKGEFYPCKPDIFAATYEEVP
jgi:hypothetical protein